MDPSSILAGIIGIVFTVVFFVFVGRLNRPIRNEKKHQNIPEDRTTSVLKNTDVNKVKAALDYKYESLVKAFPWGVKLYQEKNPHFTRYSLIGHEEEIKQLNEDVERKYSDLETRFPNGLRIYINNHPSSSEKYQLISVAPELFSDLEDSYHIAKYYNNWQEAQESFAREMRDLRDSKLEDWGCYTYDATVEGYDELGRPKGFGFKIWQLFCDSFCSSPTADYTYFPECKKNFERIPEFLNRTRKYNTWVYDRIVEFIEAIPGTPLVNIADSGLGDSWNSIVGYHFSYLKQKLGAKDIPFVSVDHLAPSETLHSGPVVFIELISNNKRLQESCSRFLQLSSGDNLTIVYISLLKEYDDSEFAERNRRKVIEIRSAEERWRKEQEERERKEREDAEMRERQEKERRERERQELLYRVSHTKKPNASAIISYLSSNGISFFYHFTDRRNLESIRAHGGLYSWKYCLDNKITIPFPGGDDQSRQLDCRHGLADYVRLSFCNDHPMRYVVDNRGCDTVLLRIKNDVAGLEGTLFSDINAADNDHHHGGTLEDLKRVDLNATKLNYVSRDNPVFKQHQAEVLVKTFIPLEYILLPDSPSDNKSFNFSNILQQVDSWTVKSVRSFTTQEIDAVASNVIVPSSYGNSLQFNMRSGGVTFIPMSKSSSKGIGESVDLHKAKLITLGKKGETDIYRVEE